METLVSAQGQKHNMQAQARKFSPGGFHKDLWVIVREGSLADVDSALALLKKNGGNINSRNTFGLTPLHIATWRNHIPIIRRLLIAGADPDARDGESGWTSLHRALHFGHLAVASILLQSGASITLEDSKSRTPVDLLSGPVLQAVGDGHDSVATEVFSWGSGANYQLGTGNAHLQKLPCKVDALHGSFIKLISAAKFHSVAVSAHGEVYTWGFGRGGRLGHPDFDIHSGQAAVITPRQVISGLGSRRVKAIAAAKHHTVLATEGGEVFTWGSNREGQLGYAVDTQPIPRRVSLLKSRIVAVAAANKHTAVVSDSGEVFTWGCNREGQLGYGTSNSASNYNPRVVEYLKGKVFTGVAVAKYHTIVLGADGEVYTWGHRLVTPRRVVIARNLKKSGSSPLKFHRMERLHVASIAAGMVHSLALTDDGALFYWVSADPDLRCQQLYSLCGKKVVSISVGKYWSAVATVKGDVYMWDGKKGEDKLPAVTRLHGVKRAVSVSVGETHLLIVGSLYHPIYPPSTINSLQKPKLQVGDEVEELDEDFVYNDIESNHMSSAVEKDDSAQRPIPSLKSLGEKVAAESLVEPRNAIQMLEIADSLGAEDLRKHCQDIVIHNLDYILTVSSHAFASASPEILATLEHLLDLRSSEPWSYRRLPTPTATFPLIINSEEEDSEYEVPRTRDNHNNKSTLKSGDERSEFFLQSKMILIKASPKKLAIESSLAELGLPVQTEQANASFAVSSDVKWNKKDPLDVEISKVSINKEEEIISEGCVGSQASKELAFCVQKKECSDFPKSKSSSPSVSKKKNRKGGLSMFLSGALDDNPKDAAPPPQAPRSEGPAWGGAKVSKGFASLREIQDEQSKTKVNQSAKNTDQVEDHSDGKSDGKVLLSSFLPSKPIPVQGKQQQNNSHSPKTRTAGFSIASGQGSPSDSPGMNRWFKPEINTPASIRSIQIEEKAMKDLKRFYSTVKIVKNPT
ncbi:hypothetical protein GH714_022462 [Hevea brasiliensis]|uniref:RCC1-like domain-containing protein n=1 Tax=Hevea brasiliensis TaxID=3981 RepID=A0A6A6M4L9_HEVBR|nr:hypothetical protein GH714_022462 [Hevea brasiliensis]